MAQESRRPPLAGPGDPIMVTRPGVAPSRAWGARPQAVLVVLTGRDIGREIPLPGHELVIGRSRDADVEIPDPAVSRRHAQFTHSTLGDEDLYTISDLGSRNGLFINGDRVEAARLVDGDRVRVGEVVLKFVVRDELEGEFFHQVHRRMHYDQLTGLLTFDSFLRELEAEIARDRGSFSLAMTDIDGLKRVNDTYGHLAGRAVVREMGVMFREVLRTQEVAALYGGDEAVVLFPCTSLADACEVAEKLRRTVLDRSILGGGHRCSVTISQGLVEWPRHGRTAEELIAAADRELYRAKADGRNCVRTAEE